MNKHFLIGLSLIAVTLVACSKREIELDEADPTMVKAITESLIETSATSKSEKVVLWNPGDEIAVFSGELSGKFESTLKKKPSSAAVFRGDLGLEAWPEEMDIWAVYPYSEEAFFDGETITTVLPSEQIARDGEFGKDMNLAIAHSNTSTLQFYNVGGGIRFSVTEEGIKKVIFEGLNGEIISGKVKIGFSEDGLPEIRKVVSGSQFITILPPDGQETFQKDTWYYIVVIPGSLEHGYKLRFYKDSDYARKVSNNSMKIKRNFYRDMERADEGIEYEATTMHFPETMEEWRESFKLTESLAIETNQIVALYRSSFGEDYSEAESIVTELLRLENVVAAHLEETGKQIYVQQRDGAVFHLVLEWEGETNEEQGTNTASFNITSPYRVLKSDSSQTTTLITPTGNKNALLLAPYYSGYKVNKKQKGKIDVNEKYLASLLNAAGYRLRFLKDDKVRLQHFWGDSLARYDYIMVLSHGGPSSICVGHFDPEEDKFLNSLDESLLQHVGRYVSEGLFEISIDNEWLEATTTIDYPNSIIYIGACHSFDSGDLLHSYFLDHNAKAYSGFEGLVNYNTFLGHNQSRNILYCMSRSLCSGMNYGQAINHIDDYSDIWTKSFIKYCNDNPYKFINVYKENLHLVDPHSFDLKSIVKDDGVTLIWNNPQTAGIYKYRVNVSGTWYEAQTLRSVTIPHLEPGNYSWYVQADLYFDDILLESYTTVGDSITISTGVSVESVSLNRTDLELAIGNTSTLKATILPSNSTNKNVTWSSSNTSVASVSSSGEVKGLAKGTATITVKTEDGGKTATCRVTVVEKKVPVSGISLNKASLSMTIGDTQTLMATVDPSNATDKSVTWASNNTSVATVSSSGVVMAKSAGSATITVKTNDGGKTATCSVTVIDNSSSYPIPEAIDLGLSVKWASFNLGASKPEEYGDYFAWGDTEPYYISQDPLIWKEGKEAGFVWASYKWSSMGDYHSFTKYCNDSYYGYHGFTDDKTVLDPEDDAAHVNLGGKWRMPTDAEWTELRENCTWEWTTINGVDGSKVTSNKPGYTDKYIFFPASGYRVNTYLHSTGSFGGYWSSTLYTDLPHNVWHVYFYTSHLYRDYYGRYNGLPVRPVTE